MWRTADRIYRAAYRISYKRRQLYVSCRQPVVWSSYPSLPPQKRAADQLSRSPDPRSHNTNAARHHMMRGSYLKKCGRLRIRTGRCTTGTRTTASPANGFPCIRANGISSLAIGSPSLPRIVGKIAWRTCQKNEKGDQTTQSPSSFSPPFKSESLRRIRSGLGIHVSLVFGERINLAPQPESNRRRLNTIHRAKALLATALCR